MYARTKICPLWLAGAYCFCLCVCVSVYVFCMSFHCVHSIFLNYSTYKCIATALPVKFITLKLTHCFVWYFAFSQPINMNNDRIAAFIRPKSVKCTLIYPNHTFPLWLPPFIELTIVMVCIFSLRSLPFFRFSHLSGRSSLFLSLSSSPQWNFQPSVGNAQINSRLAIL